MRPAGEPRPGTAVDSGEVSLDDVAHLGLSHKNDKRLVALNDALDELANADPRKAKLVELRYFGGLSVQETAAVLGVSVETVTRDWRLARGWLLVQIRGAEGSGAAGHGAGLYQVKATVAMGFSAVSLSGCALGLLSDPDVLRAMSS